MPLIPGTRLGPYEIQSAIGAGGMGEVYKARDTRLDRTVAVKVIPTHLASVPEVRERFEREARAVSSLNHPHICTLHDVGHEGETHFLVMEHLEGETLAARLEKGALPADELLRTAIEIADALAAAHRHGLVHRDLKPGNIVLARGGAKLLDFGLARTTGLAANPGSGLTQSPTVSRPLTAEGTIVGTFQYMAPEQLEGADADARTDIFAFGAVLYEMSTGKRAFQGTSQASLIASILKEEPRPISESSPMTPPALEHVVKRCLAKNPDDRWQSARDAMLELQWIRDVGSNAGVPAPVAARRRHASRLAWVLAGVFAIAAGGIAAVAVKNRPEPPTAIRFVVTPPTRQTLDYGMSTMAVAPNGRQFVFTLTDSIGTSRMWLRRFESGRAVPLTGTENAVMPFWSPDSRRVAFFANGKLRSIRLADGAIQSICDAPDGRGGSWGRDDDIVLQPSPGGPLLRVAAAGGPVTTVIPVDTASGDATYRFPCFLPDGRHFLFVVLPGKDKGYNIRVGSLDGTVSAVIVHAEGAPSFVSPDMLVFARDQAIVAQRFDVKHMRVEGDPFPVGEPAGAVGGFSGSPAVSTSATTLIHSLGDFPEMDLIWLDRTGHALGHVSVPRGTFVGPRFSPDGQRLAIENWTPDAIGSVWTVDLPRDSATRLTFDASANTVVRWSADGRRVAFASDRRGREVIYMKSVDGSAEEEPVVDIGALFTKPEVFTPGGSGLVFSVLTEKTNNDLWLQPLTGDRKPVPLLETRFNESDALLSPNGKWIVYRSDESGRSELYAQSFPQMGEKRRISSDARGVSDSQNFISEWCRAT